MKVTLNVLNVVLTLLPVIGAIAGAFMMHSPKGMKLPAKVGKALAFLSSDKVQRIAEIMRNTLSGPSGRKAEGIRLLMEWTAGTPLQLDEVEASKACDWIAKYWTEGADLVHKLRDQYAGSDNAKQ